MPSWPAQRITGNKDRDKETKKGARKCVSGTKESEKDKAMLSISEINTRVLLKKGKYPYAHSRQFLYHEGKSDKQDCAHSLSPLHSSSRNMKREDKPTTSLKSESSSKKDTNLDEHM